MKDENPYLTPTNYMAGYKESLDQFNNPKEGLELDKLVYNVFMKSRDGKKLLEYFKEKIISSPTPSQLNANYSTACIYYEGYRAGFRNLGQLIDSFQTRKDFEAKQAEMSQIKDSGE